VHTVKRRPRSEPEEAHDPLQHLAGAALHLLALLLRRAATIILFVFAMVFAVDRTSAWLRSKT
jgi:hypothetical protein